MTNNEFAQFIDRLRESRNLTREQLVDGIISKRHYYRFIKGETTINSDVLIQLIKKLEMTNDSLIMYLNNMNVSDISNQLMDFYNYIYANDIVNAKKVYDEINPEIIKDTIEIKKFKFLELVLLVKQRKISYENASQKIIGLLDYPEILSRNVITNFEKTMLTYLVNFLMDQKDYRVGAFFYSLIHSKNDKFDLNHYGVPFRTITAKCLQIIDENKKAYETIKTAEQAFFESAEYIPIIELYYRKANIEKDLFDDDRYLISLKKMKTVIELSDSIELKKKFNYHSQHVFNLKLTDI